MLTYNTVLGVTIAATITAITFATENPANTQVALHAVQAAITSFDVLAVQWNADNCYTPSSPYSVARIDNALAQLKFTLMYMLGQQPA